MGGTPSRNLNITMCVNRNIYSVHLHCAYERVLKTGSECALIRDYELMRDMRLITREYGSYNEHLTLDHVHYSDFYQSHLLVQKLILSLVLIAKSSCSAQRTTGSYALYEPIMVIFSSWIQVYGGAQL